MLQVMFCSLKNKANEGTFTAQDPLSKFLYSIGMIMRLILVFNLIRIMPNSIVICMREEEEGEEHHYRVDMDNWKE